MSTSPTNRAPFGTKPGWQRIIVLAAGSFMHFVLALFLLFVLAFAIGQQTEPYQRGQFHRGLRLKPARKH